ncbi:zeaxanthin epoxidase [Carex littledalei]|uniref:Zeaxanthin epoxidase n=1 Tax=Carex littledalei TaxID=544730 RepID=A0A833V813_9POAL|nr:zeaxanthin epoxidase [Carex littledalei]
MEPVEEIVIVGAGIAGLATALGLHRKGVKSLVLESSPTLRSTGFALGIWTNAWRALDALEIGNKAREHHLLVERVTVLSPSSGATLGEIRLEEIEGKKSTVGQLERCFWVLIGGDGINSVVAKYLGLKKPSFSGRLAIRGLAEYPTNHGFKPYFIQINGQGFRAGMIPCTERVMYWFFAWHPSVNGSEKADESTTAMREFIVKTLSNSKVPKEIIEVIQRSEFEEVRSSPLRYRSPFSLLFGDITKRNICVIGDAFHPMTPDLGQGGCLALEDTVILARCLSEAVYQNKIEEGLEEFAKIRRWRCAKVVTIAYVVGLLQQSGNWFVRILREMLLGWFMAKALLKIPDYDCGNL